MVTSFDVGDEDAVFHEKELETVGKKWRLYAYTHSYSVYYKLTISFADRAKDIITTSIH